MRGTNALKAALNRRAFSKSLPTPKTRELP